jgi:hypothetical protein
MTIDYNVKKPKDLSKVNQNELGEVLWWSYQLGISPETLILLIQQFGNDIHEIKKHSRKPS